MSTGKNRVYMHGLDGLRTIAVMAVIAYHLNAGWAAGGLLGVGIFFVLSGYLITDLLLAERERNGRIHLGQFWLRRARRLLPAMLLMMVSVSSYLALTDPARLYSLKADIGSALLYISNWQLIFHEVSYFETFGPPSPFGHLWSLAVEEQFYVLWPLLLVFLIKIVRSRGRLLVALVGLAALSAVAMFLIYEPGTDPSRVYYGTDTRAFGLLIGAALAVIWPGTNAVEVMTRGGKKLLLLLGTTGLGVMLWMLAQADEYSAFLYPVGMLLLSVATAMAIMAASRSDQWIGRLLSARLFRWLGVRSYGIYLWHYPVIVLSAPAEAGTAHPVSIQLLQVAVSIGLAALSYTLVEQPIRTGKWGFGGKAARQVPRVGHSSSTAGSGLRASARPNHKGIRFGMVLAAFFVLVSCGIISNPPSSDKHTLASGDTEESSQQAEGTPAPHTSVDEGDDENATGKTPSDLSTIKPSAKPSVTPEPTITPEGKLPEATTSPSTAAVTGKPTNPEASTQPKEEQGSNSNQTEDDAKNQGEVVTALGGITVIGDSVLLDIKKDMEGLYPGIVVDGKVSRQMRDAQDVLDKLDSKKMLGDVVVIQLGTNGSFPTKQLNKLLDGLGEERRILLVNTRVPRKWESEVNKVLAEATEEYSNVSLVDWHAYSKDHPDWFGKDGVHLKRTGAKEFAKLLSGSIESLK